MYALNFNLYRIPFVAHFRNFESQSDFHFGNNTITLASHRITSHRITSHRIESKHYSIVFRITNFLCIIQFCSSYLLRLLVLCPPTSRCLSLLIPAFLLLLTSKRQIFFDCVVYVEFTVRWCCMTLPSICHYHCICLHRFFTPSNRPVSIFSFRF